MCHWISVWIIHQWNNRQWSCVFGMKADLQIFSGKMDFDAPAQSYLYLWQAQCLADDRAYDLCLDNPEKGAQNVTFRNSATLNRGNFNQTSFNWLWQQKWDIDARQKTEEMLIFSPRLLSSLTFCSFSFHSVLNVWNPIQLYYRAWYWY